MRAICEDIKSHVSEILVEWEQLVRQQPWYSLPTEHRIDNLRELIVGLAEAALCDPHAREAHHLNVDAACTHGENRRQQGIPEHLIFTEFHLLRQAIWYYLVGRYPASDLITAAQLRIDGAITLATNASLWGYYREEIQALGKWEEGIERIVSSSPLLKS